MKKGKRVVAALYRWINRFPLLTFFIALAVLFVVIFMAVQFRKPATEEAEVERTAKPVEIFSYDQTPYIRVSGEVEKKHSIVVTARTNGIVSSLRVGEGTTVKKGQLLVRLADVYGGGIVATLTRQIAQRTEQNAVETFEKREGVFDDRRDDVSGNSTTDEIARKIETLNKRDLETSTDIARLEAQRAAIDEARYYPTAPVAGIVTDVRVRVGQSVSAGDTLLRLEGSDDETLIRLEVPESIVRTVSVTEPTFLSVGAQRVELYPYFVSPDSTNGQLYTILYSVTPADASWLTNTAFVELELPLVRTTRNESFPLVPLDAVHITQDSAFVLVRSQSDTAESREVLLGDVYGEYVSIQHGLETTSDVILNRTVIDGEPISIIESVQ